MPIMELTARMRDQQDEMLIDALLKIEESLLPEKPQLAQIARDQFLESCLKSTNPFLQIRAIQGLEMGHYLDEALEILISLLDSPLYPIQKKAIELLGENGRESEIEPLLKLLSDESYRGDAYIALFNIAKRHDQFGLHNLRSSYNVNF
jgi:HEAT repeat protein